MYTVLIYTYVKDHKNYIDICFIFFFDVLNEIYDLNTYEKQFVSYEFYLKTSSKLKKSFLISYVVPIRP